MDTFTKLAAMSAILSTAAALQAEPVRKTIYVDASAPAGGDGSSWNNAFKDFGAACNKADQFAFATPALTSGVVIDIRLAKGIYRPTADRASAMAAFQIGGKPTVPLSAATLASGLNLSILGGFAGRSAPNPDVREIAAYVSVLTSDVNGDDRPGFVNRDDNAQTVLAILGKFSGGLSPGGIVVEGITFSGGNDRSHGVPIPQAGGLFIGGFSAVGEVRRCWFVENYGLKGGGLGMEHGKVIESEFWNNRAYLGGGAAGSNLDLYDCSIHNNQAWNGGGVFTGSFLTRCEIRQNHAFDDGGGLVTDGRSRCVASFSLIAGNTAGLNGGGVGAGGDFFSWRCTIASNTAAVGGGIWGNDADLRSTIIWGNAAVYPGRDLFASSGTIYVDGSLVSDSPGAVQASPGVSVIRRNSLTIDPQFSDPVGLDGNQFNVFDNNYRLAAASPCIDFGGWSGIHDTDLDGLPAHEVGPLGTTAIGDLGCYEWRQSCPADFDNTGGTPDANDLAAFFSAFASGSPAADVNKSGGTPDSSDIQAFFNVWLAGGC